MNKRLTVLVLSLIVSACESTQQRHDAYDNNLNNRIGDNISLIVDQLGYADSISESAEGNRVFVYSRFHVSNSSISCSRDKNKNINCRGGEITEHWCKTFFEVDESNNIIHTSFKGNRCDNCSSGETKFCLE